LLQLVDRACTARLSNGSLLNILVSVPLRTGADVQKELSAYQVCAVIARVPNCE